MWVRGLKLIRFKVMAKRLLSHPMWVRGLKLKEQCISLFDVDVASYVGAWIETMQLLSVFVSAWSHPMWVRGLKLYLALVFLLSLRRILCGCVD